MSKFEAHDKIAKAYGYGVGDDGIVIYKNGTKSSVKIESATTKRMKISGSNGTLWTGKNPESLGNFLEQYWFAKKEVNK